MNKQMNVLKLVFRFLIVIVIALFVIGELVLPNEKMDESYGELFEVPWLMTREDGSKSVVNIPGNYDLSRNEKVFVETVLPKDIEENFYLCFFSNRQDMEIYVDDELRQEYSTKDTRPYGRSSSAAFVFMKIREGDGGKVLRVSYQTDTAYSGRFRSIYYGEKIGIWGLLLKDRGGELVVSILLFVLAIASVREEYLQEGFADYLSKPVQIGHLQEMIRTYLPSEYWVEE